jgi:hypothetical protein
MIFLLPIWLVLVPHIVEAADFGVDRLGSLMHLDHQLFHDRMALGLVNFSRSDQSLNVHALFQRQTQRCTNPTHGKFSESNLANALYESSSLPNTDSSLSALLQYSRQMLPTRRRLFLGRVLSARLRAMR